MREYLRLLPFGYSVAAGFIPLLHVPLEAGQCFEIEDTEETFAEFIGRGGEAVDWELRALLMDMSELRKRLGAA